MGRFGGGEKLCILHSLYLRKLGYEVELFYNGPILPDWQKRVSLNIPFHYLPYGYPWPLSNISKLNHLSERLKRFDKILVHHHIDTILAFYLSKRFGGDITWYCGEPIRALWEDRISGMSYKDLKTTVVATSKGSYGKVSSDLFLSNYLYPITIGLLRILDKKAIRSYPQIIANSKYTKGLVENVYELGDNVNVVYPGIETSKTRFQEAKYEDMVLMIASMIPMKNHFNILKALKILNEEHTIKLVLIGGGPLKSEVMKTISDLKLSNVTVLDYVSEQDLMNYYKKCCCIVHPALFEPFGLVPIEAAIYSKPSIVSNIGGTRETVIHGKTGFRINPMNPEDIAEKISVLFNDKKLSRKMGLAARQHVFKNFTIEKSSKQLSVFLENTR